MRPSCIRWRLIGHGLGAPAQPLWMTLQWTTVLGKHADWCITQKSELLADETVVAYLGSMEISQNDLVGDEGAQSEDDFS